VAVTNYIGMHKELYGLKPIFAMIYRTVQSSGAQAALSKILSNTMCKKEILLDMKKVNRTFDRYGAHSVRDDLANFLKHLA